MPHDLRELLHDTADGPTRSLDPSGLVEAARRRTRRRTASVVAVVVLVAAGVPVVASTVGDPAPPPAITDRPEGRDDAVVPDGWVTLTAGELAVSVPPDWRLEVRNELPPTPDGHPEPALLGGPCVGDLYLPAGDEAPRAVVSPQPTSGLCNLLEPSGPPAAPGLVLYDEVHISPEDEEYPGQSWLRSAGASGERTTIGHDVEVWRTDVGGGPDGADGFYTSFVATDGGGGLYVSHLDDPVVQRVLASVRRSGVGELPPPVGIDGQELPPDDMRDLHDLVRDDIAETFPEYAGHYTSRGVLHVMLVVEPAAPRLEELRQAIVAHHDGSEELADAEVRTEPADFSWLELHDARALVRTFDDQTGIHTLGIDEQGNQLRIGIDAQDADAVRASVRRQFEESRAWLFEVVVFEEMDEPTVGFGPEEP